MIVKKIFEKKYIYYRIQYKKDNSGNDGCNKKILIHIPGFIF